MAKEEAGIESNAVRKTRRLGAAYLALPFSRQHPARYRGRSKQKLGGRDAA
jgi:hypothetical protein